MKKHAEILQYNRSWFIKLFSLTIMILLIAPVMIEAQTGKANFSGNWVLNTEKSTFSQEQGQGGGQRMGTGNFVARQEDNLLTVERTWTNQNGESMSSTMKYTLDGKESANTTPRGNSKSVASWSSDGKTLTINTTRTVERNGETREMKSTELWSLADANTLSVKSTSTTPGGERKNSLVYDKK
jgi:hypothetical protein